MNSSASSTRRDRRKISKSKPIGRTPEIEEEVNQQTSDEENESGSVLDQRASFSNPKTPAVVDSSDDESTKTADADSEADNTDNDGSDNDRDENDNSGDEGNRNEANHQHDANDEDEEENDDNVNEVENIQVDDDDEDDDGNNQSESGDDDNGKPGTSSSLPPQSEGVSENLTTHTSSTDVNRGQQLDLPFILREFYAANAIQAKDQGWIPETLPLELLAYIFGNNLGSNKWKNIDCWLSKKQRRSEVLELKSSLNWKAVPDLVFPPKCEKNPAFLLWKETRVNKTDTKGKSRVQENIEKFMVNSNGFDIASAFLYKVWELKYKFLKDETDFSPVLMDRYKTVITLYPNREIWKQRLVLPTDSQFQFKKVFSRAFAGHDSKALEVVNRLDREEDLKICSISSVLSQLAHLEDEERELTADIKRTTKELAQYREKKEENKVKRAQLDEQLQLLRSQARLLDSVRKTFGDGAEALAKSEDLIQAIGGSGQPDFGLILLKLCDMTKCDVQSAVQEINDKFLPKDVASTSSSMLQVPVPATVAEQNLVLEALTEDRHDKGRTASPSPDGPPRTPTYDPEAPDYSPRQHKSPQSRRQPLDPIHSQTSSNRNFVSSNPVRISLFGNIGSNAPSVPNPTAAIDSQTAVTTPKPKKSKKTSSIPKKDADASRNVVEQNPMKNPQNADLSTNVIPPVNQRPSKTFGPPAKKAKVVTTVSTSKDASSQREPRKSGNDKRKSTQGGRQGASSSKATPPPKAQNPSPPYKFTLEEQYAWYQASFTLYESLLVGQQVYPPEELCRLYKEKYPND